MRLDDRLTIETPEGVSIELTLAGLGSRLGAAVVDITIQAVVLLALVLALTLAGAVVSADLGIFVMGVGTLLIAVVVLGYYLLFEALNGGRTPGKAAFGIRVATVDGRPVTLVAVTLRTLLRLIDFLPFLYATGAVSVVVTAKNQRLGDLVANTVVVRDRQTAPQVPPPVEGQRQGWDVATVTDAEMALVRRYASRRHQLTTEARARLAAETAARLRPKVTGGQALDDEEFLLQLLVEKSRH
jgi:uncharacterized RDD family membrane protein YckC